MNTLRQVLQAHGINTAGAEHRHGHRGWVQIDCPFCPGGKGSNKFHLGINTKKLYGNCWKCGRKSLWAILEAYDVPVQVRKAIESDAPVSHVEEEEHTGTYKEPDYVTELGPAHRKYLESRGFDPDELVEIWELKGIGLATRLKWRIFVPIVFGDKPVSWTTRSLGNTGIRYISASPEEESMSGKTLLYGEQYCHHSIIVHEGISDVWATGPGSVATMGTSYTRKQIERISKYPVRAICFDVEPVAQERARRLASELSMFKGETHNVVLETGTDSGDANENELQELRDAFL